MPGNRHFTVVLVDEDADGKPSDLYNDLLVDRARRVRSLERLTDDFVVTAKGLKWRRGPKGAWILVSLGDDYALCQWNPGDQALWELCFPVGRLSVIRVVRKADVPGILQMYAPSD
jgi:hypothetical protein